MQPAQAEPATLAERAQWRRRARHSDLHAYRSLLSPAGTPLAAVARPARRKVDGGLSRQELKMLKRLLARRCWGCRTAPRRNRSQRGGHGEQLRHEYAPLTCCHLALPQLQVGVFV